MKMGLGSEPQNNRTRAFEYSVCMPNGASAPPCKSDEVYGKDGCCYRFTGVTNVDRTSVRNW